MFATQKDYNLYLNKKRGKVERAHNPSFITKKNYL